jgi:hypothetical protein
MQNMLTSVPEGRRTLDAYNEQNHNSSVIGGCGEWFGGRFRRLPGLAHSKSPKATVMIRPILRFVQFGEHRPAARVRDPLLEYEPNAPIQAALNVGDNRRCDGTVPHRSY